MVARASHSCQEKQFDQSERCSVRDLGTRRKNYRPKFNFLYKGSGSEISFKNHVSRNVFSEIKAID